MASQIQAQLENAQNRHATLINSGRNDAIAKIVIERVEIEILTLKRKLKHEEEPRQEVTSRTSTSGVARRFREALHRYGIKCYGNHNTVSAIPTVSALQEARATT